MSHSTLAKGNQLPLFPPGTDDSVILYRFNSNDAPRGGACSKSNSFGTFSTVEYASQGQSGAEFRFQPTQDQVAAVIRAAHEPDEHVL